MGGLSKGGWWPTQQVGSLWGKDTTLYLEDPSPSPQFPRAQQHLQSEALSKARKVDVCSGVHQWENLSEAVRDNRKVWKPKNPPPLSSSVTSQWVRLLKPNRTAPAWEHDPNSAVILWGLPPRAPLNSLPEKVRGHQNQVL